MAFGEGAVSFGNIKVSTQLSLLFSFKKKKKKTSAGFFFNLIFFFFFFFKGAVFPYPPGSQSLAQRTNLVRLLVVAFLSGSLNPKVLDVPSQGMLITAVESHLLAESPCP